MGGRRKLIVGVAAVLVASLSGCGSDAGGGGKDLVRLYTVAAPPQNERFEKAFEEAHPEIDLQVTRGAVDLLAKVDSEIASNTDGADIFMYSGQTWFLENEDHLAKIEDGDDWPLWGIDGLAATVSLVPHSYIVWNKQQFPDGFDSWDDALDPSLKGKIGARENVDVVLAGYMQYLEDTNGPDFLPGVAAQNPKLYPSAIPLTQAVGSGEIGAAIMSAPAAIKELQDQGAPVDFWLPEDGWAVGFNAGILKKSKHQKSAQVVLDYFMSPEGQAAFNGDSYGGSPLDGVKGAVDVSKMEVLDAKKTTQAVIDEWNTKFRSTFK